MNYKFLTILLLGISMFSFGKPPPHIKVANDVTRKSMMKIANKYNVNVFGTGGSLMHNVKELGVSFQMQKPLKKEEARELIVAITQDFLHDINQNAKIQPYLVEKPFTAKNVEVEVFFRNSDNTDVYDPYIRVVSVHKGKISYATKAPEKEVGYETYVEEPFEEALTLLGKS